MKLTKREREILPLMCLSNKQISEKLFISPRTASTHVVNIMYKFPEQENRYSVVLEAVKRGIITIEEVITK